MRKVWPSCSHATRGPGRRRRSLRRSRRRRIAAHRRRIGRRRPRPARRRPPRHPHRVRPRPAPSTCSATRSPSRRRRDDVDAMDIPTMPLPSVHLDLNPAGWEERAVLAEARAADPRGDRGRGPWLRPVRAVRHAHERRAGRRHGAERDRVRGRSAGRRRGRAGRAVRRARRPAADAHHQGDGRRQAHSRRDAGSQHGVHLQRAQVPAAGEPQPTAERDRDVLAVSRGASWRRSSRGSSAAWASSPPSCSSASREPSAGCAAGSTTYQGAKLIVTYHPAACLRNPNYKRPVWEDMQLLAREYAAD